MSWHEGWSYSVGASLLDTEQEQRQAARNAILDRMRECPEEIRSLGASCSTYTQAAQRYVSTCPLSVPDDVCESNGRQAGRAAALGELEAKKGKKPAPAAPAKAAPSKAAPLPEAAPSPEAAPAAAPAPAATSAADALSQIASSLKLAPSAPASPPASTTEAPAAAEPWWSSPFAKAGAVAAGAAVVTLALLGARR